MKSLYTRQSRDLSSLGSAGSEVGASSDRMREIAPYGRNDTRAKATSILCCRNSGWIRGGLGEVAHAGDVNGYGIAAELAHETGALKVEELSADGNPIRADHVCESVVGQRNRDCGHAVDAGTAKAKGEVHGA